MAHREYSRDTLPASWWVWRISEFNTSLHAVSTSICYKKVKHRRRRGGTHGEGISTGKEKKYLAPLSLRIFWIDKLAKTKSIRQQKILLWTWKSIKSFTMYLYSLLLLARSVRLNKPICISSSVMLENHTYLCRVLGAINRWGIIHYVHNVYLWNQSPSGKAHEWLTPIPRVFTIALS